MLYKCYISFTGTTIPNEGLDPHFDTGPLTGSYGRCVMRDDWMQLRHAMLPMQVSLRDSAVFIRCSVGSNLGADTWFVSSWEPAV